MDREPAGATGRRRTAVLAVMAAVLAVMVALIAVLAVVATRRGVTSNARPAATPRPTATADPSVSAIYQRVRPSVVVVRTDNELGTGVVVADDGTIIVKLYLHITKDEQLSRFRLREADPYKHWKITDEDWRNRARWNDYTVAVNDMVARTSTRIAPWTLVEANNKNFARVKVLRTLADRLARRLR